MDKYIGRHSNISGYGSSNHVEKQNTKTNHIVKPVSSENTPKSTIVVGFTKKFTVTQSSLSKHSQPIGISQKREKSLGRSKSLALEDEKINDRQCRSGTSSPLKSSPSSLKYKGSLLLHHVLHPVEYYNERKRSRSRHSSANSDQEGYSKSLSTKERHASEGGPIKTNRNSFTPSPTNAWPVYRPHAHQRLKLAFNDKRFQDKNSPYNTFSGYPTRTMRKCYNPEEYRMSYKTSRTSSCSNYSSSSSSSSSDSDSDSDSSDDNAFEDPSEVISKDTINSEKQPNSDRIPTHGHTYHKDVGKLRQKSMESEDDSIRSSGYLSEGDGLKRVNREQSLPIDRISSTERLYSIYDQIIEEGLLRRHSMEPDKRGRHNSGGVYRRGEMDPNQVAEIFRDSRGLPATDTFLENVKRSDLEEDESQIFVKFFQYHECYDLIPTSAKLVIFDTRLPVKKAFHALVFNGVRAAPLWDSNQQRFVGMLTITDFIRILQSFYHSPHRNMEELEDHRLEMWRTILNDECRPLISITPDEKLYVAIRSLIHHKIHRLPVIEPVTGNALYIITHKRILKFLYLYINDLPKPSILQKTLRELNLGTYDNIQTATEDTLIVEALNKFVEHRVSALPIVDEQGKLINIYAKFDVINLAAEGTYHNLDVTLRQANERRNEWFEGVQKCTLDETLSTIMERIVRAEVHRLVVTDSADRVIGVISLSDILKELVLKPCGDEEPGSLLKATVRQMEEKVNASEVSEDTNSTQISTTDLSADTTTTTQTSAADLSVTDTELETNQTSDSNKSEDINLVNGLEKVQLNENEGKKWSSNDRFSKKIEENKCDSGGGQVGVGKVDAAKASPADSEEDEGRYSISDADDPPAVTTGEIIRIPG